MTQHRLLQLLVAADEPLSGTPRKPKQPQIRILLSHSAVCSARTARDGANVRDASPLRRPALCSENQGRGRAGPLSSSPTAPSTPARALISHMPSSRCMVCTRSSNQSRVLLLRSFWCRSLKRLKLFHSRTAFRTTGRTTCVSHGQPGYTRVSFWRQCHWCRPSQAEPAPLRAPALSTNRLPGKRFVAAGGEKRYLCHDNDKAVKNVEETL